MLQWDKIDQRALIAGKPAVLKHTDRKLEYDAIAKKVLGLKEDASLKEFRYVMTIWGVLSECDFGAQFRFDRDVVSEVLTSVRALPISHAFELAPYRDDLLHLFEHEEAHKPNLAMLKAFIKTRIKDFQALSEPCELFWISEWSDVNCWAVFWQSDDQFHCLGKKSG